MCVSGYGVGMGESDRDCAELAMAYQQARAAADDLRVQWDRHLASDPGDSAPVALAVGDPQRAFETLDAVQDAEHAARRALFECTQLRRASQALRAEADQLEDEASALVARQATVPQVSGVRRPSPSARPNS